MTSTSSVGMIEGMERPVLAQASDHAIAMGSRLREARRAAGLTGDELARRVGCGTTVQKISNYETGRDRPPHLFLYNLEVKVGITASWVIAGNRASLPGWILDKMQGK